MGNPPKAAIPQQGKPFKAPTGKGKELPITLK